MATKVDTAAKQWRVEMRSPVAGLNLPPKPQATGLYNVTRERYATGQTEFHTWSPLKGNFHAPKLFGTLTGMTADFARFKWDIGAPQVTISGDGSGNHRLRLKTTVTNGTAQTKSVVLAANAFLKRGGVQAPAQQIAAGASAEIELPALKLAGNPREAIVEFSVLDTTTQRAQDRHQAPRASTGRSPSRSSSPATARTSTPPSVPELVFQVQWRRHRREDGRVCMRLMDAADKPCRARRAGQGGVATQATGTACDQAKLGSASSAGTYALTARAYGQGRCDGHQTATTIRKLVPATGSEVRV